MKSLWTISYKCISKPVQERTPTYLQVLHECMCVSQKDSFMTGQSASRYTTYLRISRNLAVQ